MQRELRARRRPTGSMSVICPIRKPPSRTSLPDDQARGVRDVDADDLDRYERQPAVGLVGEQYGPDEDEHRDGADEDRSRRPSASNRASWPEEVVEEGELRLGVFGTAAPHAWAGRGRAGGR